MKDLKKSGKSGRPQALFSEIFSCTDLSKKFGPQVALDGVTLKIQRGQVYGLLGPNGSGKTTFLSIAMGVLRPTRGDSVWYGGEHFEQISSKVGSLLESPRFFSHLSAVDNLKITAQIRGAPSEAIAQTLEEVGLSDVGRKKLKAYSLGMKQRLAVAKALMGDPEVLVLDEPINGIDAEGIAQVRELILKRKNSGRTILISSHILDELEKVCTHVGILKSGRLLKSGPVGEILQGQCWFEILGRFSVDFLQKLNQWPAVQKVETVGETFRVFLKEPFSGEDLNRFAFDHGVTLRGLVEAKKSLEEQFLEVVR